MSQASRDGMCKLKNLFFTNISGFQKLEVVNE